MNKVSANMECISREQAMLYVDGGLSPSEETVVEMHVDGCAECRRAINFEKSLLGAIGQSMTDDCVPEVPADFVKAVTAAAESDVRGLRSSSNRSSALVLTAACGAAVAVLVAFGYSAGFKAPKRLVSVVFRILALIFHSVRDLVLGTSGVLRSVCADFVSGSYLSSLLLLVVFILSIAIFSRLVLRQDRA